VAAGGIFDGRGIVAALIQVADDVNLITRRSRTSAIVCERRQLSERYCFSLKKQSN
jgi:hypothetical protein